MKTLRPLLALVLGLILGAAGLSLAAVDTSFQGAGGGGPRNPAFTFQGDTETGMYQQGAGRLEFSVSGKQALRLSSSGLTIPGDLVVGGTFRAVGAGTFNSTLQVDSNFAVGANAFTVTAASGNTIAIGTLGVTGNFAVNTNKFNVTATSGDTSIAGVLGVTGAATLSSTTSLGGDATFTQGATRTLSIAAVTGAVVGNQLNLTAGAATAGVNQGGDVLISGGAGFGGGVAGRVITGTSFAVGANVFTVASSTGNTQVAGTFGSTGAVTHSTTLTQTGISTFGDYIGAASTSAPITFKDYHGAPGAPTATLHAAAGALAVGSYTYKITVVTPGGETTVGTASAACVTAGADLQCDLSAIPLGDNIATQRKVYRSFDGGAYTNTATVADNTTTTYNDAGDAAGAAAPASNTALDTVLSQVRTAAGLRTIRVSPLPASAGGANQKVLCVDSATGSIYVSATALDCS